MRIIEVTPGNIDEFGIACVKNQKHIGYPVKRDWYINNYKDGLRIQLLYDSKTACGMIEYLPAEYAWRPVSAPGCMFIHCIWVYPKKNQGKGHGSALVQACLKDAERAKMKGVVTVASDGSWVADRRLYEKNGFELIESRDRFDLMYYHINGKSIPEFLAWETNQKKYEGLNLVYAAQCPYFHKVAGELAETAREYGVELNIVELKTAKQAQSAPSGYGTFSLIYNGRLLEDHYISKSRFRNILTKEIG